MTQQTQKDKLKIFERAVQFVWFLISLLSTFFILMLIVIFLFDDSAPPDTIRLMLKVLIPVSILSIATAISINSYNP